MDLSIGTIGRNAYQSVHDVLSDRNALAETVVKVALPAFAAMTAYAFLSGAAPLFVGTAFSGLLVSTLVYRTFEGRSAAHVPDQSAEEMVEQCLKAVETAGQQLRRFTRQALDSAGSSIQQLQQEKKAVEESLRVTQSSEKAAQERVNAVEQRASQAEATLSSLREAVAKQDDRIAELEAELAADANDDLRRVQTDLEAAKAELKEAQDRLEKEKDRLAKDTAKKKERSKRRGKSKRVETPQESAATATANTERAAV